MKFCTRCGAHLTDDTTFCVHCGQPMGGNPSANAQQSGNVPPHQGVIIKQDLGRLWLASALGGIAYGVMMFFLMGVIGLLSGIVFGGVFGLIMQLMTGSLEKKWAGKRAEISATKTIIVEGAANLKGNGGWLFFTREGVEYYRHKVNLNSDTLIFPNNVIQSVHQEGKKLVIIANNEKYVFVVNYVDQWMRHIYNQQP